MLQVSTGCLPFSDRRMGAHQMCVYHSTAHADVVSLRWILVEAAQQATKEVGKMREVCRGVPEAYPVHALPGELASVGRWLLSSRVSSNPVDLFLCDGFLEAAEAGELETVFGGEAVGLLDLFE
jgi:hypothetical protein